MRICAVTMHGPDTGDIWKDAYLSVRDLVDGFIGRHPGQVSDFSYERNVLLEMANGDNYDWAIMLDTDERISLPHWHESDATIREMLGATDADILMVPHISGTYEKERIFRLPARGQYRGRTHEAWITDDGAKRETVQWMSFDEIPKTPESYRLKVERDRVLLEAMTKEHPDDPRWWYYLGDTLDGLGERDRAVQSFERCWDLNGWDEESAWAAFRVATIRSNQEAHDLALIWCLHGMRRRADFPEFPWLAGYSCYHLGRYEQAVAWSRLAVTNQVGGLSQRIGFRHPPAHYEGPWDVMRWAYKALGRHGDEEYAERRFERTQAERT